MAVSTAASGTGVKEQVSSTVSTGVNTCRHLILIPISVRSGISAGIHVILPTMRTIQSATRINLSATWGSYFGQGILLHYGEKKLCLARQSPLLGTAKKSF
jgi:hypothetical protein